MHIDTTSIVSLLQDHATNSHSIVGYFVCAAPPCALDFKAFLAGYPKCIPSNATTSYLATANALKTSCRSIAAAKNGTCQPTDVGHYTRARYYNPLTRACAATLTPFNITTSTQWYDAIQQANASSTTPALLEAFCTTDACVSQTNATLVSLSTCTLDSGENLYEATSPVVEVCARIQTNLLTPSSTAPIDVSLAPPTHVNATAAPIVQENITADPTVRPLAPDSPRNPTPHATQSKASSLDVVSVLVLLLAHLV
ncbi:Aste57867_11740 [Aphanomyces stellatus]|uniref:Aste57867_11740 protein n=1 Tax=Aphanomyces stellatus TaxID=120398 RepID=A0A485KTS8_9STRA|nr:hypothetical protein As57867_011696 [Aphanomyces stellatus]VFT88596.1 Aste57867_11740 [Aphanomyces stellatus]